MPDGLERPAGLGEWRAGTELEVGEPREGGPALVGLGSAIGPGTGKASAARRVVVTRRTASGAPPQGRNAVRGDVIELDLDPRASAFEVWSVGDDGAFEEPLSRDRPSGGRSL